MMASLPGWSSWSWWPCLSCCNQFWIPNLATFGNSCLGIVSFLPAWIALVVLFCHYGLRPLWRRRPHWLRNFAAEDDDSALSIDLEGPPKPAPWPTLTIALFVVSLVGASISFILSYVLGFGPLFLVPVVPSLISCLFIAIDCPRSTPGAVFLLHAAVLVDQLALLLAVPELIRWPSSGVWLAEMAFPAISLAIILAMPMRNPLMDDQDIGVPFQSPTNKHRSPEDNFSLWHWMTVSWMGPLISIANHRQLNDGDVWLLPYQFQHRRLHHLFREVSGSVTARIVKANAPDLLITSGLGILESVTNLLPIILLKYLLAALEGDRPNVRVAVVYAVLTLCANLVAAQSGVFSIWFTRRCYERSRGEMITMIYEKTLRRKAFTIPSHVRATGQENGHKPDTTEDEKLGDGPASTGKILNLLRSDVYEVAQRFWDFPQLITRPLNFILCIVFLWQLLGPASFLGILVLLAAQVLNYFVIRALVDWETRRRFVSDLKLQVISQFIEAIRHLRWYDWQDKWLNDILTHRQKELWYRVITNILSKGITTINQVAGAFFPVAAFYAYTVIAGQTLSVEVAFPALNLFNLLDSSLRELPNLVTVLLNAAVAMRRIESFMAEANKEATSYDQIARPLGDLEIDIQDASFAWPGQPSSILKEVSLRCQAGLTLVCGKVGTGKTALLQAMLGEMDQHGGETAVPKEMIGYCSQTPWLQSMSIKENILFCMPYDKTRLDKVLDACCLKEDLVDFKAGENSLIGENGIGLSGGQRARVALARAVYSRARILFLDDPIAALDHQTAETIMWRLFSTSGLMEGRLVVFVTHRVDIVTEYAHQIVEVCDNGTISCMRPNDVDTDDALLRRVTSGEDDQAEEAMHPLEGAGVEAADAFIEEEYRAHGGVVASVYWRYVKAGKLKWWACIIVAFIAFRIAKVGYFWFLKVWGEAYEHTEGSSLALFSAQAASLDMGFHETSTSFPTWFGDLDLGLPPPDQNVKPWLFWFTVLSLAQLAARTFSNIVLIILTYTAAKQVFRDVMYRVSNATFRFFDVTPVGRLLNRVTSDIGTVDGQIAGQIHQFAWFSLNWIAAMVVIASTAPLFLVLAMFMTATFIVTFLHFLPASQSLRRLEMVSLSPLMSNFGTLLEGLTTVRAFYAQPHFQQRNIEVTDDFQKMDHFYWSLQAWLQFRFDALSALSTFALTLTALRAGLSSGTVAFVLAAAANFVSSTHNLCRRYGELQMQFVSVERVVELLDLDTEPPGDVAPPAAWPTRNDDIVFADVSLRYAPHLDPVLRDVSLRIPAGATVAVTGRTGSGKTTLALALLGTVLPDVAEHPDGVLGGGGGGIFIGGVDVARVNKHALRRRVSFVAQDPVLFPGTLRENLDPLGEHSDEECAAVLGRVMGGGGGSGAGGAGGGFTIWSRVDGGGRNLSQGQRQLVGLGRAVLRRSPVVILDEATASIDKTTAFYIQEVLREELRYSTVITIAHRVEVVKAADFLVVMHKGRLKYAGPPVDLDGSNSG